MRLFRLAAAVVIAAAGLLSAGAAQAFSESYGGIYTVLDQKTGQTTQFAYRFYVRDSKWVAEERAPDGSWTPIKCDKDCEIRDVAEADLPKTVPGLDQITPSCIANSKFAFCSYSLKKETAAVPPRFMMVLNTPQGKVVLLMAFTSPV